MRILHLTSHLNIGGISRYIVDLSKPLMAQGHQIIIASAGGNLEAQAASMGITLWTFPFDTSNEFGPQVFFGARQLMNRLTAEPVDLIHAHTRTGQVVAERISHRLKIPYVTTWHGIYRRRLGRKLWPCIGEKTIAISSLVREHLLRDFGVSQARIQSVYNGIDVDYYATSPDPAVIREHRARWGISNGQPVIGGVGRLAAGEVKGFDLVLVAAYLLVPTFPNLYVLIVGDGPRRPFLEDVTRRLRLENHVHFIGAAEDVRIPLAVMDVFVFSSRWPEAFGLTLVEAMAAGKSVVATQMGAVPEIVEHGVSGWVVPVEDPAAMADGISRLLKDPEIASRMGRQAQSRVREAFGLDRMAREIESVYQEVVHG